MKRRTRSPIYWLRHSEAATRYLCMPAILPAEHEQSIFMRASVTHKKNLICGTINADACFGGRSCFH